MLVMSRLISSLVSGLNNKSSLKISLCSAFVLMMLTMSSNVQAFDDPCDGNEKCIEMVLCTIYLC